MYEIFSPESYHFVWGHYFFWAAVINAVAAAVAGPLVLFRDPHDKRNRAFFYFTIAVFVWAVPYAFWQISTVESVALFWTRGLMAGAMFSAVTMLNFHVHLIGIRGKEIQRILLGLFIFFTIAFFANFTPYYVKSVEPESIFPFWPKPGPAYHVYVVVWLITLSSAYLLLLRAWIPARGLKKKQFGIILVGNFLTLVFGATNYFLWYGIQIIPWGTVLVASYSVAAAYAIIKYRLFEITSSMAGDAVIETVPDPIIVTGLDGIIWIANRAALSFIGQKIESVRMHHLSTVIPKADELLSAAEASFRDVRDIEPVEDLNLLTDKGQSIPVSISFGHVRHEGAKGYVFICHDIRQLQTRMTNLTKQRNELEAAQTELEQRNKELLRKNEELDRVANLMKNRELKMIQLKKHIEELESKNSS